MQSKPDDNFPKSQIKSVILSSYNPEWPSQFLQEAALLRGIFGKQLLGIQHIGSTSIPGMTAKPLIDIQVEVVDILFVDTLNPRMEQAGYSPQGEFGLPGRRFFIKRQGEFASHHIHTYPHGHPDILRHQAFRDYLRAIPDEALRYMRFKEELAARFPDDRDAYQDGKNALIKELESAAIAWMDDRTRVL